MDKKIEFIDLKAQQAYIRLNLEKSILKVLDHGKYIMGPEVKELEKQLEKFTGSKNAVSCSNGTDALVMSLMALDTTSKDAVIVPSFTFAATAEAVALIGATPIFVDCCKDTFNIDTEDLINVIEKARTNNINLKGIIAADMFGQPSNYRKINEIAQNEKLWIIADSAQSLGATHADKNIGQWGTCTTTSFFPAKPLGCYGDGGCVFTDNDEIAERLRSIRVHGKGTNKYDNVVIGLNARLDTIQAAVLIEKLNIFPDELTKRNKIANYYYEKLNSKVKCPVILQENTSSWAQYTLTLSENLDRNNVIDLLKAVNIPSAVYYPKPLHLQPAYENFQRANNFSKLENCNSISNKVLSIPMSPYLSTENQDYIINNLIRILAD
jgi:dTDP-4-amino-4,6-dideoxygalactose transaminase